MDSKILKSWILFFALASVAFPVLGRNMQPDLRPGCLSDCGQETSPSLENPEIQEKKISESWITFG